MTDRAPSPAFLAEGVRREVVTGQTRLGRRKFSDYYEDALAELGGMGLTPTQIEALRQYGLLATDNVTGFHEGRSGGGRVSTLRRAVQHVRRTGEQAFYVEMDLQNLGGLNAALGHTGANEVYREIAAIIREELSAVASEATFFRHGGDETSAFLIDTTEAAVRGALEVVRRRVAHLARRYRVHDIPHPKHGHDLQRRGIGIHYGVSRLTAACDQDPALVFRRADTELERRKRHAAGRSGKQRATGTWVDGNLIAAPCSGPPVPVSVPPCTSTTAASALPP
jgi:diguanylate cyclase (GGDEF)-like protein